MAGDNNNALAGVAKAMSHIREDGCGSNSKKQQTAKNADVEVARAGELGKGNRSYDLSVIVAVWW